MEINSRYVSVLNFKYRGNRPQTGDKSSRVLCEVRSIGEKESHKHMSLWAKEKREIRLHGMMGCILAEERSGILAIPYFSATVKCIYLFLFLLLDLYPTFLQAKTTLRVANIMTIIPSR